MRRRFGLAVIALGMLGVHTTRAQLAQPAGVRDLPASQTVWPSWNNVACLTCVARGDSRHKASADTAVWSITNDSTGHRHPLAGAMVGAVAGVVFAYAHAQNDARKCQGPSCDLVGLEPAFTMPLFGLAGAVVGGFIGWMIRTEGP